MNREHAHASLSQLEDLRNQRELELQRHSSTPTAESDDEADADCPIFDSFYESDGNEGIMQLTNLTSIEFRGLYHSLHDFISKTWNVGRGRKSSYKAMDVLLMTMAVLKHGGTWDWLGRMFRIKGPTFERLIVGFLEKLAPHMHDLFVKDVAELNPMAELIEQKTRFKNFDFAIEAVDVTFQQANRPSGNMQEGKKYFSGKHHLYGYKFELSVRPNGLASGYSQHHPGSVADITILESRLDVNKRRWKKRGDDTEIEDEGEGENKYPNYWAVLLDKGYQGSREMFRALTPYKKPPRGVLTADQESYNKNLSSDRILVENYFGRMLSLWNIMAAKYRWGEELYDPITTWCVALTNYIVRDHPLRQEDIDWYKRYKNRLLSIGKAIKTKRSETQALYRSRRRRRLEGQFRPNIRPAIIGSDEETQAGSN